MQINHKYRMKPFTEYCRQSGKSMVDQFRCFLEKSISWLHLFYLSPTVSLNPVWHMVITLVSVFTVLNVGSEHNMIIYLSDSSLSDNSRHCSRWSGELSIDIRYHSLEQYGKQTHKIFQTLSCLTAEEEQKCGTESHSFDVDFKTNSQI